MSTLSAHALGVRIGPRVVLEGVTLTLRAGEVTAILGPNGAGKSTLLSRLCGLRRADAGEARLDDRPLLALSARDRARRIAFLEQTPQIAWAIDVRTLVGLGRVPFSGARGLSAEDNAAVERAMDRASVTSFANRLVTTLSGGERARVLLARALAGEPEWLLADEPLTGLDPGHQLDACALFRRIAAEGAGVVLTLHDLSLASRVADRLVVLHEGRVVADGPPAQALTADLLARTYGVEATLAAEPEGLRVDILRRL